jgi:hypothetical protein
MFSQKSQLASIRVLVQLSFYKGELCRLAFESLSSNFIINYQWQITRLEMCFEFVESIIVSLTKFFIPLRCIAIFLLCFC